jgi:SAM-dependent methyltransferase
VNDLSTDTTTSNLKTMVRDTVRFYDDNADAFWSGTRDHDVSQNRNTLTRHLNLQSPLRILDFGCGPGRDLKHFVDEGHQPIGLDASAQACAMAREWSGCEVWQQDFLALDLPSEQFDGVFANASLFHVPSSDIDRVLTTLHGTLKSTGILLASNPRGNNQEGWQVDRFGVFYDLDEWQRRLVQAGFELLDHYLRPPGQPLHQQPWLVTVAKKLS